MAVTLSDKEHSHVLELIDSLQERLDQLLGEIRSIREDLGDEDEEAER